MTEGIELPTAQELASSLDELFTNVAEVSDMLEILHEKITARDRVILTLARHTERLLREKEELMSYVKIKALVDLANKNTEKKA